MQALAAHIAAILSQRSVHSVAPVQAADVDRNAVKRTLKGLVTDILGAELPDLAPFMEVNCSCLTCHAVVWRPEHVHTDPVCTSGH